MEEHRRKKQEGSRPEWGPSGLCMSSCARLCCAQPSITRSPTQTSHLLREGVSIFSKTRTDHDLTSAPVDVRWASSWKEAPCQSI